MSPLAVVLICVLSIVCVDAFVAPGGRSRVALKPLQENFFIDLPTLNDPSKITPKLLNGEANYKGFVEKYDPDALLLGGAPYNAIGRVADLQLLTKTVDSGLLQALEEKGLTLTQLERALPIIDNAGLLPLLIKNKGALLGLLPLLVEPAPSLLPLLTSIVKTPASTYSAIGAALIVAGGFEGVVEGNTVLGVLPVLLALPALALGAVLGKIGEPLPAVSATARASVSSSSAPSSGPSLSFGSRPRAAARKSPKSSASVSVKSSASGGERNGKRKVVRVN